MADYYTNLSFMVECKQGDQALLLKMLNEDAVKRDETEEPGLGVCYKSEGNGIWFQDDAGYVEIEGLCDIFQSWLRAISDETRSVGFEWANTCTKPRLDAFGGGAVFIRKDEVRWLNTGSWLHERKVEEF